MTDTERRVFISFLSLAAWGLRRKPEMALSILRRVRDAANAILSPLESVQ